MLEFYKRVASLVAAKTTCLNTGNHEWYEKHDAALAKLCDRHLPSGSGFNDGVVLLEDECQPNKLVFQANFQHMDDNGSYTQWTYHNVIVTPDLVHDISLKITGPDHQDIKGDIGETMFRILFTEVD